MAKYWEKRKAKAATKEGERRWNSAVNDDGARSKSDAEGIVGRGAVWSCCANRVVQKEEASNCVELVAADKGGDDAGGDELSLTAGCGLEVTGNLTVEE